MPRQLQAPLHAIASRQPRLLTQRVRRAQRRLPALLRRRWQRNQDWAEVEMAAAMMATLAGGARWLWQAAAKQMQAPGCPPAMSLWWAICRLPCRTHHAWSAPLLGSAATGTAASLPMTHGHSKAMICCVTLSQACHCGMRSAQRQHAMPVASARICDELSVRELSASHLSLAVGRAARALGHRHGRRLWIACWRGLSLVPLQRRPLQGDWLCRCAVGECGMMTQGGLCSWIWRLLDRGGAARLGGSIAAMVSFGVLALAGRRLYRCHAMGKAAMRPWLAMIAAGCLWLPGNGAGTQTARRLEPVAPAREASLAAAPRS